MIVIVANRWNQTPKAVVSRWAPREARVLTSQDLSVTGWRQSSGGLDCDIAVVEGKLVLQKEVTGVLTLLPCVFEEELVDIAPAERRYVAAEMTAFLLFWLSRFKCPVLNRPTPTCLSGPYWRREKWVSVAAQAGIPVELVHRHAAPPGSSAERELLPGPAIVTVIGRRIFGEVEPALRRQAQCIADLAGVELLAVHFSGPERGARFVSADVFPKLSEDRLADAVLDHLQGGLARCA
jgi:hypothetical protein